MIFDPKKGASKGFYDTSTWTVLDHPPPPDGTDKKKKKKRFMALIHKNSVAVPPEAGKAEVDVDSGSNVDGKGGNNQSKSALKSGKYVAVDSSGELGEPDDVAEYEEDEDENEAEKKLYVLLTIYVLVPLTNYFLLFGYLLRLLIGDGKYWMTMSQMIESLTAMMMTFLKVVEIKKKRDLASKQKPNR